MLAFSVTAHLPQAPQSSAVCADARAPAHDRVFWILALAATAYALAEGTFSNWAILYLQDDVGLDGTGAASALTAFWAALTVGRLAASVLALRIQPIVFLCVLPPLMIGALVLLRTVDGPQSALLAFAFAGLSCSAFFPMLVAFAAANHARHVSWIAAMLTAALMVGVGLGSYAVGSFRATLPIRDLYLYACAYPVVALAALLVAARLRGAQRLRSGFR
jgi:fucose permease